MKRFCFRIAASALALAMFFSSAAANAYTSTGADGAFQPTVSVALDPAQQVFNFTDIFIPGGVTVSFGGLTSAQQILLLATGNISIAGTLDAGANSLLIETPGNIFLTGSLNTQGSNLTLVSGGVLDVSGAISVPGGAIALNSTSGATITGTGGTGVTFPTGDVAVVGDATLVSGGLISTSSGAIALNSTSGAAIASSGSITLLATFTSATLRNMDETLLIAGNASTPPSGSLIFPTIVIFPTGVLLSPIPETEVWVMLSIGFCALFAASRRRYQHTRMA
ncbi:MAG: hypothetical protein FD134_1055 [Gallionellaceae bacterium]|nr:MAG: hypothetical protein FD134_1055 [Gallionellaceae bacterium]